MPSISRCLQSLLYLLVLSGVDQGLPTATAKSPEAFVLLRDGRTVQGVVDANTDGAHLWLRREGAGMLLAVSTPWEQVAEVQVGDRTIAAEEFRRQRESYLVERGPVSEAHPHGAENHVILGVGLPRVTHLKIQAWSDNWDRDFQEDGLVVAVMALDAEGVARQVDASFQATLVGQRVDARTSEVEFGEIERWSERIDQSDFRQGVAWVHLPYRTRHPEYDWELDPDVELVVRLGVHGHGSFEAAVPLCIRPFNPARDQWHDSWRRQPPVPLSGDSIRAMDRVRNAWGL